MKKALLLVLTIAAIGCSSSTKNAGQTVATSTPAQAITAPTAATPLTFAPSPSTTTLMATTVAATVAATNPATVPATVPATDAPSTTVACAAGQIHSAFNGSCVDDPASEVITAPPPVPDALGLVWESAVDPARVNITSGRPTGNAKGIASAIDIVAVVKSSNSDCASQIAVVKSSATQCVLVQWSFDVDPTFRVDSNSTQGLLVGGDLVTAEGTQITNVFDESGYPGTKANRLDVMYPGGDAGSTIRWQTGSNLVGFTTFKYTMPTADQLLPLNLDD